MSTKLAITIGDPAGIGPEITVKALEKLAGSCAATPVVVGDLCVMEDAVRLSGAKIRIVTVKSPEEAENKPGILNLIDLNCLGGKLCPYGQVSAAAGDAAFQYIVYAIGLAQKGQVDAVVTGPINKEAVHLAGHDFAGHTEIFAHYTNAPDVTMLLSSQQLKVVHVTTHVSMEDACRLIAKDRVLKVIRLAQDGMQLLGVAEPRIAVAGFNAHSSENGLFGHQEADAIIPAIEAARAEGINADGPIPPDTVFVKAAAGMYDIVVAMYHDQGHIPLKLLGFRMDAGSNTFSAMSGVNCTLGLPFIRSSVDHGTAFDRAGKNISNPDSMVEAIEAAEVMSINLAKRQGKQA